MKSTLQSFALMLLAFVVVPELVVAQTKVVVTVIACKGKITLERTKKPVAVGAGLNSADQLRLEGPVYLGLVFKSGKTLEIRQEGVVNYGDHISLPEKPNWIDTLVNFVTQLVKAAAGKNITFSSGEILPIVNKLRLISPRTTKTIDDEMTFTWHGTYDGSKSVRYLFTITDERENLLFKRELPETHITVNTKQLGLEKDRCYYWSVTQIGVNTPKAERYCVQMVNDKEKASLIAQINILDDMHHDKPTALDKLMLAAFYEQNGLTYRARSAYQDAAAIGRDIGIFSDLYREFLHHAGVDDETIKVLGEK